MELPNLTSAAGNEVVIADIRKMLVQHELFQPHRGDHYFLFLNKGGSYSVKLDFQKFLIDKPAFLLIAPGHVRQVMKIKDLKGYGISFDKASVYHDLEPELKRILNTPVVVESHGPTAVLFELADLFHKLQQEPSDLLVKRASEGILHALLNLMVSQGRSGRPFNSTTKKRASIIGNAFMVLLEKNYKVWKEPSQYAGALSVSTNHLNDVVKATTGKSVTAHIHSQSILEARRLLHFTNLTVKEIGYQTGFRHTAYFNKLFKRITGMTPLEVRNKFRV